MRVVLQRVLNASVEIEKQIHSRISNGLLVFACWEDADTLQDLEWMAGKISRLRIFDDENGVMNKAVTETGGEILIVSQFTLYASTKKGNRPSYIRAAKPEISIPFYEKFTQLLEKEINKEVKTGIFGADMKVSLVNDGPVTIIMDSKNPT
ncbi:MAG: D-aminoacyl-tRNA deacylase [Bacteroidia bacterium]